METKNNPSVKKKYLPINWNSKINNEHRKIGRSRRKKILINPLFAANFKLYPKHLAAPQKLIRT